MEKFSVSRVFITAHVLPLGIFTVAVFAASFFVSACGPSRGSALKDPSAAVIQTDLNSNEPAVSPSSSLYATNLQQKLAGVWTNSSQQSITFSPSLDQTTVETITPLDNNQGNCHIQVNYSSSVQISSNGAITLQLSNSSLGKVLSDSPSLSLCQTAFKSSSNLNLSRQDTLTHSDDWSQITYDGVTYKREAIAQLSSSPSVQTASAETWIAP